MIKERIDEILSTLTPHEQAVIRMRYGFEDGYLHSLEEVGRAMNTTRAEIMQIEAKALRLLRHPKKC